MPGIGIGLPLIIVITGGAISSAETTEGTAVKADNGIDPLFFSCRRDLNRLVTLSQCIGNDMRLMHRRFIQQVREVRRKAALRSIHNEHVRETVAAHTVQ